MFEQTPSVSPDQVNGATSYANCCKSISMRAFEFTVLLAGISDHVGTPSSLNERQFETSMRTNFDQTRGVFNLMHGKDFTFTPSTYKYAPNDLPESERERDGAPRDDETQDGGVRGVPTTVWNRVRQNLAPGSMHYKKQKKYQMTTRFSPHIAEAIYQVENVLRAKKVDKDKDFDNNGNSQEVVENDEPAANPQDNDNPLRSSRRRSRGGGGGNRGGGRGRGGRGRGGKRYDDEERRFVPKEYVLPWNFKSVSRVTGRYVYCNWAPFLFQHNMNQERLNISQPENSASSSAHPFPPEDGPADVKEGYFGVPNTADLLNLPKIRAYLIFLPVTANATSNNDQNQLIIAIQFLDPHYDAVALYKFIQQKLLRQANFIQTSQSNRFTGGDCSNQYMKLQQREMTDTTIPGLDEGFVNEMFIFPEKSRNTSITSHPKFFFDFLLDYYCMASDPDVIKFRRNEDMSDLVRKCKDMSEDANMDYYSDITSPLNPHTLFSLQNAINFLRKEIALDSRKTLIDDRIHKLITPWTPSVVTNSANANDGTTHPLRPEITTLSSMMYSINVGTSEAREMRVRCFTYEASEYRWCFYCIKKKRPSGLVTQFMPLCSPALFELEQTTFDKILEKVQERTFNARKELERQLTASGTLRVNEPIIRGNLQSKVRQNQALFHLFVQNSGQLRPPNANSSQTLAPLPPTDQVNGKTGRLRWESLFDKDGKSAICEATDLKVLPDSQFAVGLNTFLTFIYIIETRIFKELDSLKPKKKLNHPLFNKMYSPSDISIDSEFEMMQRTGGDYAFTPAEVSLFESYLIESNDYVEQLIKYKDKISYFMTEIFFNPKVFPRFENNMTEGWKAVIAFIQEMQDNSIKSQECDDPIVELDPLSPCHYATMTAGDSMRSRVDSPCSAVLESMSRRLYEQATLYQNNLCFYAGIFGPFSDIFKVNSALKFSMFLEGRYCNGKSFLLLMLLKNCIPGVPYVMQKTTTNSFQGTGLEADRGMFCTEGLEIIAEDPAQVKAMMTDHNTDKTICFHNTETGQRIKLTYKGAFYNPIFGAHNDTLKEIDPAMNTRFHVIEVLPGGKLVPYVPKDDTEQEMTALQKEGAEREGISDRNYSTINFFYGDCNPSLFKRNSTPPPTTPITSATITPPTTTIPPLPASLNNSDIPDRISPLGASAISDYRNLMLHAKKLYELRADPTLTGYIAPSALESPFSVSEDYSFLKAEGTLKIRNYWRYIMLIQFYMNKLQAVQVIVETSKDFFNFTKGRFKSIFKKYNGGKDPFEANQRTEDRLLAATINICEWDAIQRVFFDRESPYYSESLTPNFTRAIEPYLSISFEHMALAASIITEEIVDNIRAKIMTCMMYETNYWEYSKRVQKKFDIPTKENIGQSDYNRIRCPNFEHISERKIYKEINGNLVDEDASGLYLKVDRAYCQETDFHSVKWALYEGEAYKNYTTHTFLEKVSQHRSPPPQVPNQTTPQAAASSSSSSSSSPGSGLITQSGRSSRYRGGLFTASSPTNAQLPAAISPPGTNIQPVIPPQQAGSLPTRYSTLTGSVDENYYDLNKIAINLSSWKGSITVDELVPQINQLFQKHRMPEIPKKFLKQELERMHNDIQLSGPTFDLVPQSELNSILGSENILHIKRLESILTGGASANANDGAQKARTRSGRSNASFFDKRIMTWKSKASSQKGQYDIQVMFDVKALQHINENHIMIQTLETLAAKLPMYTTRIALLFHKAGGRLSYIHVGDRIFDGEDTLPFGKEKLTRITLNDDIDDYRKAHDYGISTTTPTAATTSSTTATTEASGVKRVLQSNPYLDINDYYRALHIINGNFLKVEYDKIKRAFYVYVPDYRNSEPPVKYNIEHFFDSRYRHRLWKNMLDRNTEFRSFFAQHVSRSSAENAQTEQDPESPSPTQNREEVIRPDEVMDIDMEEPTSSQHAKRKASSQSVEEEDGLSRPQKQRRITNELVQQ